MPHTPFSPGEQASPRDDQPRWFEPVGPALIEPTFQEEEWSAAAESGRLRDPVAWRDVRWVEFGDADEPSDDRKAADARIAGPPAAASISVHDTPASDVPDDTTGAQPGSLRNRLASVFARLFRLGCVAVSLILAAIFLYKGGEMLAGFAGATTPPATLPEPAWQPQTAATAVPAERLPVPTAATAPESVGPRIAEYLAGARTGEPVAQYNLAVLYALGNGIAQDYASAASWFRKAAESGHPAAQFNLAVM